MISNEKLQKFAELTVKIGANMQVGQEVAIRTDIATADFARLVAECAYHNGAKKVTMYWRDEKTDRINMLNSSTEALCDIPAWEKASQDEMVNRKMAIISIFAGDPNNFNGCDSDKVNTVSHAQRLVKENFLSHTMNNYLRWTLVSVPTVAWSKMVFPESKTDAEAIDKMWDALAHVMRLNESDPVVAWEKHIDNLHRRADILNKHNFEYLHLTNSIGTDLVVGLATNHIWLAAEEEGQDGIKFTANMPTEEIFTAPHKYKVNGIVHNALPLVNNGNVIDDFTLTFKDGRVVDYTAKVGLNALKGIVETDEGSHYIGEMALIGKHSPIAESGILFYNTLFDENASCHIALGKAYPTTVAHGNDLTPAQLDIAGLNTSMEHCDFMIGTKDFSVVGIGYDGKETVLFVDGE
ncbi:MAG: aminopeptidase, partial [Clostridia bacterium]